VLEVPLAVGGAAAGARAMSGYPHPVEEVALRLLDGPPTVEVTFPVGGTTIATSGLYGAWQVEAEIVDGRRCHDPAGFSIGE
jgi:hypothetical protein